MEEKWLDQEEWHLKEILIKLEKKIAEVEVSLQAGWQDINRMQEYYWQNYTEMDEYGYENFDNQQALRSRVMDNQEKQKDWHRYQKMLDSPYFGRIDFLYDGEEERERFYIGIGNFSEDFRSTPLIFDWRAPVSSLFYDYEKGRAEYLAPVGKITGEVIAKYQYKIKKGKLQYAFESEIKIDDDILKRELGMHTNASLKNIVCSIQKEQNQIIRNREDRILVVQGSAGSGKTSIALHRIAYLLYHERQSLCASQVLILSPNRIFSDYISHILPELGEEQIKEMSFDDYAYCELKEICDCEDCYDQIERNLSIELKDKKKKKKRLYHQSESFAKEIYGYVLNMENDGIVFRDIKFKKIEKTKRELEELFYYKFSDIPFLKRMEYIAEYLIDEEETLKDKDMDQMEKEIFLDRLMKFYRTRDIYQIYSEFLVSIGEKGLPNVQKEKRMLRYEHVFPMLYLKYLLEGVQEKRKVKHLIIDEMQDYSYLQYLLIRQIFSCKMTIVGDRAQTMEEVQRDVLSFLPKIFGKQIRMIEIRKSYRSTIEIASYAAELIGDKKIELMERHGKAPSFFLGGEELWNSMAEQILADQRDGMETIGILGITQRDALEIKEKLQKRIGEKTTISYLDKDSRKFYAGVVVTSFYLAKGLEFDSVYAITKESYQSPLHKQGLYICATRALHQLQVYTFQDF